MFCLDIFGSWGFPLPVFPLLYSHLKNKKRKKENQSFCVFKGREKYLMPLKTKRQH